MGVKLCNKCGGVFVKGACIKCSNEREAIFCKLCDSLLKNGYCRTCGVFLYENSNYQRTQKRTPYCPTIKMAEITWKFLHKYSNQYKWSYPITLSCNSGGEVWFCTSWGKHPVDERNFINTDVFSSLGEIVAMVLEMKPMGGRFHADEKRVFLTDSEENEIVCKIQLTSF